MEDPTLFYMLFMMNAIGILIYTVANLPRKRPPRTFTEKKVEESRVSTNRSKERESAQSLSGRDSSPLQPSLSPEVFVRIPISHRKSSSPKLREEHSPISHRKSLSPNFREENLLAEGPVSAISPRREDLGLPRGDLGYSREDLGYPRQELGCSREDLGESQSPDVYLRVPNRNSKRNSYENSSLPTCLLLLHQLEPYITNPTCPPRKSVDPMSSYRKSALYPFEDPSRGSSIESVIEPVEYCSELSVLPQTVSVPPQTVSVPPKTVSVPSKTVSVPSKTVSASPKTVSSSSKTVSVSPRTVSASPRTDSASPKTVSVPPKTVPASLRPGSAPPRSVSVPPKPVSVSPRPVSVPPKSVSASPRPISVLPKALSVSPKPVSVQPPQCQLYTIVEEPKEKKHYQLPPSSPTRVIESPSRNRFPEFVNPQEGDQFFKKANSPSLGIPVSSRLSNASTKSVTEEKRSPAQIPSKISIIDQAPTDAEVRSPSTATGKSYSPEFYKRENSLPVLLEMEETRVPEMSTIASASDTLALGRKRSRSVEERRSQTQTPSREEVPKAKSMTIFHPQERDISPKRTHSETPVHIGRSEKPLIQIEEQSPEAACCGLFRDRTRGSNNPLNRQSQEQPHGVYDVVKPIPELERPQYYRKGDQKEDLDRNAIKDRKTRGMKNMEP